MAAQDNIMALVPGRTNWDVVVRITSVWATVSLQGIFMRQNLLLLDSENNRIHATCTPEIWNQFHNVAVEGTICNIRNFSVFEAVGNYRPVRHPFIISFIAQTIITVFDVIDAAIPLHKFDIRPLSELPEQLIGQNDFPQNQYSTDIIGVVEDLEPVQFLQSNIGEIQSVRFKIFDGSHSVRVRLSGMLDEEMAILYENYEVNPMIVILAGTKIQMFKGYPIVYNLPCTKIYINLDCPEVIQLKQRLINKGFQGFLHGN